MTHSSHSKETRLITFSLQLPCIINSNLLFIMIIYNYTHTHAFRQGRVIVAHELYTCLGRGIWAPSGTPCRPPVLHRDSKRLLPNLFHPIPFSSSSPSFSLTPRHPLSSRDTITFCKRLRALLNQTVPTSFYRTARPSPRKT